MEAALDNRGGLRYTNWSNMSKSLEDELFGPSLRRQIDAYLEYHQMREARPRTACSDCQFEYAPEDGHECDPTLQLPPP